MTMRDPNPLRRARGAAGACLLLILAHSGCGLDEVKIPELSGPSELGTALKLSANPDVITADGFSTSLIQVEVFDQDGSPAPGRVILLAISDSSPATPTGNTFLDLGTLNATSGSLLRAAEATVVTNGSGVATAIYTAPPRTDFTANGLITIVARPVGTDANGVLYRSVKIELKSAEPKLFPATGGAAPVCNFVVEAPQGSTTCSDAKTCSVKVNTGVLFQDTSSDSDGFIVRYDWYFGDGSPNEDSPDTNHVFRITGNITVTHRVTDNTGLATACSTIISVSP